MGAGWSGSPELEIRLARNTSPAGIKLFISCTKRIDSIELSSFYNILEIAHYLDSTHGFKS